MRKITEESIKNFLDRVPFKKANMEVSREGTIYYLKLHGNKIAALEANGKLWISCAGWKTRTTKERLNGLSDVTILQKNGNWYLNGNFWQGEPICVSDDINKLSPSQLADIDAQDWNVFGRNKI
jgi:hypothetical protein